MEVNKIIQGDTLSVLKTLSDESVNCVVTSPPYWSLRDYGIEPVIWDGDKDCEHEWKKEVTKRPNASGGKTDWAKEKLSIKGKENYQEFVDYHKRETESDFCQKCGAWRGSLGLEPTFDLYIKHLCDIFDEVKKVLRKDGTCWVNIGDTYSGGGRGWQGKNNYKELNNKGIKSIKTNISDKSLCLIPQRFVVEMVNRGWICRNTIIWKKPNCMPSSARDRFTVDFEYVYFFVKSKKYWFEQQFQPIAKATIKRSKNKFYPNNPKTKLWYSTQKAIKPGRDAQTFNQEVYKKIANGEKTTANKRTVWTIPTHPFSEAHFAVYPEKLVETPIKAGCPRYVCKKCGKARVLIIDNSERINTRPGNNVGNKKSGKDIDPNKELHKSDLSKYRQQIKYKEIGYTDCGCGAGFEGGIVLDPFSGSGTTAVVAKKLGRQYLGIEIKQEYIDMANKRIRKIPETLF